MRTSSSPVVLMLLAGSLMVGGCAGTKQLYQKEAFKPGTPFSAKINRPSKIACWSVKRAFLAQGYMLDRSSADSPTLTGVKEFQKDEDTNVTLRLQTSCADNNDGTSTVYATAMQEVNKLQDEKQHRSVGIGWLTLTVPAASAKALRPLSRETVSDPDFYKRFYALVAQFAEEDAKKPR